MHMHRTSRLLPFLLSRSHRVCNLISIESQILRQPTLFTVQRTMATKTEGQRRSSRLQALKDALPELELPSDPFIAPPKKRQKKATAPKAKIDGDAMATKPQKKKAAAEGSTDDSKATVGSKKKAVKPKVLSKNTKTKTKTKKTLGEGAEEPETIACLPRFREGELTEENSKLQLMGIDEAGRGPLAGPVVAAAIIAPVDLAGVIDSKKINTEAAREALYEKLVAMPNVRWAISIIDAARIDEINILQATLEGMRMAAQAVIDPPPIDNKNRAKEASVTQMGCYVVCSDNAESICAPDAYALIDGNRLPKEMPCGAETIVKGDSKEFCVAAASILAKVTRDRLMHGYDALYPEFNLKQHKGYPTAAHMIAVKEHGASPIHRRTFAPLKHMEFDENGKVVK
jgi:ribonuclease HII